MVVQVGDGDLRVLVPQRGDELRGGQRAAAERKEVRLRAVDHGPEQVPPQPGQPARRAAQVDGLLRAGAAGRWPRQGVAVDLARRAGRQLLDPDEAGYQRGRQLLGEPGARLVEVELRVRADEIADEHRGSGGGAANRGRPAADPRQVDQRGIDLAQLDAAPPDLDLVIAAAAEVQPIGFQANEIAAAIGARPVQDRHRGVLLGVLVRIQVAGQPHAADHELAHPAVVDRPAVGVDDGQVPARQRQPDADRPGAVEPCRAGHDGGLGRAVGVPHLAAVDGEPLGQLRGTGLPAKDQQPHRFQRLGGPQRGQRRHRRDHGHVAGDQPRTEVHPAAHQRPRRGNQAGTVPPRQPHLLARRVESHRQPGQHPVPGPNRVVPQEHLCLGVDERGGVAVRDGHAFGGAGRS